MSPRPADPAVRTALVEAAARLLADQEPVTLRRVAAEVGTSTMAVYTYFGSMDELRRGVRDEGFARLAEHLAGVPATGDAVSDLLALAWAYCRNAVRNPDLYRAMFVDVNLDAEEAAAAATTFLPAVEVVERSMAAGRIRNADAWGPAVQLWAFTHGLVTLTLGGMLTVTDLVAHFEAGARAFLAGLGDSPAAVGRSLSRARRRMLPPGGLPPLPPRGQTLDVSATQAAARSRH